MIKEVVVAKWQVLHRHRFGGSGGAHDNLSPCEDSKWAPSAGLSQSAQYTRWLDSEINEMLETKVSSEEKKRRKEKRRG
jgi:hypothetical protein